MVKMDTHWLNHTLEMSDHIADVRQMLHDDEYGDEDGEHDEYGEEDHDGPHDFDHGEPVGTHVLYNYTLNGDNTTYSGVPPP